MRVDAHGEAVARISVAIARALGVRDLEQVERAGLLHDAGKSRVPAEILEKPGPLTPAEWTIVRRHPEHSHRMLIAAGHYQEAVAALHHHERWDGTGYPHGLAGEAIPQLSRILAVADAYDAMISTRPYRAALSRTAAVAEIQASSGTQLDPACVGAFMAIKLPLAA